MATYHLDLECDDCKRMSHITSPYEVEVAEEYDFCHVCGGVEYVADCLTGDCLECAIQEARMEASN